MHASLHELLSLRDEVVVDGAVAAHVHECGECRTELERLRAVTAELRALPAQAITPDRWWEIESALLVNRLSGVSAPLEENRQPGWKWPLAAAAAVLGTVAVFTWRGNAIEQSNNLQAGDRPVRLHTTAQEAQADSPQVDLVARSRELERVLAVFPDEPAVMHASTALTLAELQDRIRWVDYRLSLSEEAGLEPQQSELLWRERIDLLNSLVAVRYAQARSPF